MEVSRLTLSEEITRKMQNPRLSSAKKKELRTELILDYIRNQPSGTKITKRQLGRAARYSEANQMTGYKLVNSLIKEGIIHCTKDSTSKSIGYEWTIPGDTKITPVRPLAKVEEPIAIVTKTPESIPETIEEVMSDKVSYSIDEIITKAKDFAWKTDSDSLREFINWLSQ